MAAAQSAESGFRYERAVRLQPSAEGLTCVALDGAVFAHTARRSADDLRLYRTLPGGMPAETPYSLVESEAALADDAHATVRNARVTGNTLSFDLLMPQQMYSSIDLDLDAQNFVARAVVTTAAAEELSRSGRPVAMQAGAVHAGTVHAGGVHVGMAAKAAPLGVFTLFDLSAQHLPRRTTLALAESHARALHVVLTLWGLDGRAYTPAATIIRGAIVPPSREAQTLYAAVATTTQFTRQGNAQVATLHVPAHVPVERVRFLLASDAVLNFERTVRVTAVSTAQRGAAATESMQGVIAHVQRAGHGPLPPLHDDELTLNTVLGANLREPADVQIAISDAVGEPLPVRAVTLEMRQRSICFQAAADVDYALRYGDDSLSAPVYDTSALMSGELPTDASVAERAASAERTNERSGGAQATSNESARNEPARATGSDRVTLAALGPEVQNANYRPGTQLPPSDTPPPLYLAGLLGMLSLLVSVALFRMRRTHPED